MLGLKYSRYKSSAKCHLFNVIFAILGAFEKPDLEASIFCEAADPLSLPSMELDILPKRIEKNTELLLCLLHQTICFPLTWQNWSLRKHLQVMKLKFHVDSAQQLNEQLPCS